MARASRITDSDEPQTDAEATTEVTDSSPEPAAAPQAAATTLAATDADPYEPYPGATFFHGGRHSPIVAAMGSRLHQEGHAEPGQHLGPDWTNAHKRAFAAWQHQLRPKEGGDVSGIPDEVAWNKLQVPRVSPPAEES